MDGFGGEPPQRLDVLDDFDRLDSLRVAGHQVGQEQDHLFDAVVDDDVLDLLGEGGAG